MVSRIFPSTSYNLRVDRILAAFQLNPDKMPKDYYGAKDALQKERENDMVTRDTVLLVQRCMDENEQNINEFITRRKIEAQIEDDVCNPISQGNNFGVMKDHESVKESAERRESARANAPERQRKSWARTNELRSSAAHKQSHRNLDELYVKPAPEAPPRPFRSSLTSLPSVSLSSQFMPTQPVHQSTTTLNTLRYYEFICSNNYTSPLTDESRFTVFE